MRRRRQGRGAGHRFGGAAPGAFTIAVIPKGTTHEFWQSIRAGAEQAGQELGRDDHLARPAARGRSRLAGLRGRRLRQPRRVRASCSRRSTRRRWCSRSTKRSNRKIPVVIFDSGLEGRQLRQLRRHRQPEGRQDGRRAPRAEPERQGQGHPASLRRGARQHRQARAGFPRRDEGEPGDRGRQLEPVRRRRRRRRLQEGRIAAEHLQEAGRLAERSTASSRPTSPGRSRCCACCRTTAGPAR